MLETFNLGKKFGRRQALNNVQIEVRPREIVGVVGASGAGKSTLARLLVGLIEPSSGQVRVLGRTLRPKDRTLRRRVPLVFQEPGESLDPRLSAQEILAPFVGESGPEPWLERVGLSPQVLQRRPHELSGGQKQRLALVRALAVEPAALVLDEPTSSLDRPSREQVLNLLLSLGIAQVLVTHDLSLVSRMCSTAAVLQAGRLVEMGSPSEVFGAPRHPATIALVKAARRLGVRLPTL